MLESTTTTSTTEWSIRFYTTFCLQHIEIVVLVLGCQSVNEPEPRMSLVWLCFFCTAEFWPPLAHDSAEKTKTIAKQDTSYSSGLNFLFPYQRKVV